MPVLKKFVCIFFLSCACSAVFGQADSTNQAESTRNKPATTPVQHTQPVVRRNADSAQYAYADSVLRKDSLSTAKLRQDSLTKDSLLKSSRKTAVAVYDTSTYRRFTTHPQLAQNATPVFMLIDYHKQRSRDELFYLMAGVVLILAFIRTTFSKYFRNLFLLFLQTSLRQKQTRDQLLQDNLASLLTNFLFVISAGLYLTLLIKYKGLSDLSFWLLAAGAAGALLLVYLVKYVFLLFTGWVFNTREASGSYIFVVFLVNKVLGIVLVPFLLVFAFADPELVQVAITLSVGVILLLLGYRYWVSFIAIRSKLKVNALHFLLYLCAVEILPLAVISKLLMNYFNGSL